MKIQIKNIFGKVLFEGNFSNIAEAVSSAIKSSANLRSANLSYANLSYADLSSADLSSANLSYADLGSADLSSADLSSANLSYADLRYANLRYANLRYADLSSANLRYANLRSADLRSANLRYANLRSADLHYANLRSADLHYVKNCDLQIARTRILPDGDIVGWKKCAEGKIVKLIIPASAKRTHAFGRKCRAEFAKVVEIIGGGEAASLNDPSFKYRTGEIVKPTKPFSDDWMEECESGIHFYITRIEAENHY